VKTHDRRTGKAARRVASVAILLCCLSTFSCAGKKASVTQLPKGAEPRADVVNYAVSLLGKPYKSAAKGPDAFDCSGLVYHVYKQFRITLPVSTAGLNKAGTEVSRVDVMPGDLVIFKIKKDQHVGIMLNRLEFIHASKSKGVAVDRLDSNYWKKSFSGFRRVL
jgi:cell wall-associated NlpC family hydrolase